MIKEKKKTDTEKQFFKSLIDLMKQDFSQVGRVFSALPEQKQKILLSEIRDLLKAVEIHKKRFEAKVQDLIREKSS